MRNRGGLMPLLAPRGHFFQAVEMRRAVLWILGPNAGKIARDNACRIYPEEAMHCGEGAGSSGESSARRGSVQTARRWPMHNVELRSNPNAAIYSV